MPRAGVNAAASARLALSWPRWRCLWVGRLSPRAPERMPADHPAAALTAVSRVSLHRHPGSGECHLGLPGPGRNQEFLTRMFCSSDRECLPACLFLPALFRAERSWQQGREMGSTTRGSSFQGLWDLGPCLGATVFRVACQGGESLVHRSNKSLCRIVRGSV